MIRMGKSIRRKWVKDTVKDLYLKLIGADNNRAKQLIRLSKLLYRLHSYDKITSVTEGEVVRVKLVKAPQ